MKITFVPNETCKKKKKGESAYDLDVFTDEQKAVLLSVRNEAHELLSSKKDPHIKMLFAKQLFQWRSKQVISLKNRINSNSAFFGDPADMNKESFLSPKCRKATLASQILHDELRILRGEGRWEIKESQSEELAAQ